MESSIELNKYDGFAASSQAQVLLEMAGCHDLFVNPAHNVIFGEEQFTVVKTPDEVKRKLADITHSHRGPCYCDKIGAIYSLRSEFCVFESAYEGMRNDAREKRGIGFFQVSENGAERSYKIYRVHTALVKSGQNARSLMECWIVPFAGLTVSISGKALSSEVPEDLSYSIRLNGQRVGLEQVVKVPPDPGYMAFHDALSLAIQKIEAEPDQILGVRDFMLEQIRCNPSGIAYEPIEGSIVSLFESNETGTVLARLIAIRHRLFDALVLKEAEEKIEAMVQQAFSAACHMLHKDLQWNLGIGYLTLGQLIALDGKTESRPLQGFLANGGNQNGVTQTKGVYMQTDSTKHLWKADLDLYRERKAIEFPDRSAREKVLEALWKDDELFGMPRDYAGTLILVVPDEAVNLLQKKGFTFIVRDVEWK